MCAGRAGAVPGKNVFRESSGRVPGKFREPFREPVGLEVPGRFGQVPGLEVPGTGSKVRAGGSRNRFREPVGLSGTGSKVTRFQNPHSQEPF